MDPWGSRDAAYRSVLLGDSGRKMGLADLDRENGDLDREKMRLADLDRETRRAVSTWGGGAPSPEQTTVGRRRAWRGRRERVRVEEDGGEGGAKPSAAGGGEMKGVGGEEDGGEGGAKPSAAGGGEMKGVGCRRRWGAWRGVGAGEYRIWVWGILVLGFWMERGRGAHLQVTVTASESRKRWPSSVLTVFYALEGRNEEFLGLGAKLSTWSQLRSPM
jgi:hypothetical protein